MKKLKFLISKPVLPFCLFVVLGCSPWNKPNADFNNQKLATNVIYGTDGRLDLYQVTDNRLKLLTDATVALVSKNDLSTFDAEKTNLNLANYGQQMNLCPTEKYREQSTLGFCSGSLIGPDIILTAGHCVDTISKCEDTAFIFGFSIKLMNENPDFVLNQDIYHCKEIIKTEHNTEGADFSLIRLDRVVTNHQPLQLRPSGEINLSDSLVVIGHPGDLPTKITTGGAVRMIFDDFFRASLDTYGGSSGSAVFNTETGFLEGVLVRGEMDYEHQGTCRVSKICAEDACRGEDVTKISVVQKFLAAAKSN